MLAGVLLVAVVMVLAWTFPTFGLVMLVLAVIAAGITAVVESRGAVLLLIPAAGVIWLAYQGTYLWYSPDFWSTVATIAVIAAVIGVIMFLFWLYEKKAALAVTIAVLLVVAGCVALGIYMGLEEMVRFGGVR